MILIYGFPLSINQQEPFVVLYGDQLLLLSCAGGGGLELKRAEQKSALPFWASAAHIPHKKSL